jgi:hypothetical protein
MHLEGCEILPTSLSGIIATGWFPDSKYTRLIYELNSRGCDAYCVYRYQ